jgi:hypothetical protein
MVRSSFSSSTKKKRTRRNSNKNRILSVRAGVVQKKKKDHGITTFGAFMMIPKKGHLRTHTNMCFKNVESAYPSVGERKWSVSEKKKERLDLQETLIFLMYTHTHTPSISLSLSCQNIDQKRVKGCERE